MELGSHLKKKNYIVKRVQLFKNVRRLTYSGLKYSADKRAQNGQALCAGQIQPNSDYSSTSTHSASPLLTKQNKFNLQPNFTIVLEMYHQFPGIALQEDK